MINKQIEQVFVVKSVAPAGLDLWDLKPYQIAIFNEGTQKTVASPLACKGSPFSLVWKAPGSGNGGSQPDQNNVKVPLKSLPMTNVDGVWAFEDATPERKVFEAYLGYNGISPCKSLSLSCGETYQVTIHAKGKPVRDLLGADYTEVVPVVTGCCDGCTTDEAVKTTLTRMVEAIKTNAHYITNFFDVYPVYKCCPEPDPFETVAFQDYCVTICDDGSPSALGDVQVKYQSLNIYRSAREGGLSTYRTDCASSLPAPLVQTDTKLTNCTECPAGYTAVPGRKKYFVTIDNAGTGTTPANWLTEVQAAGAFSAAVAATRLSFRNGTSSYEVLVPLNFVEPASPISETTWVYQGIQDPYCIQTTPTSTAWVQCGTRYKVTRKLCMTLRVNDCADPAADLAALLAYYANTPNIVPGTLVQTDNTDCIATYEVEQYSPCVVDGCDWFGKDVVKFEDLPGYLGQSWSPCECEGWTFDNDGCPVPPEVTVEQCQGGIKFVGKNFDNDIPPCADDIWQEVEDQGVELEVAIGKFTLERCEPLDIPFQVVQWPSSPNSTGRNWLRREVQARRYANYKYWSPNQPDGAVIAARRGEIYGVEVHKNYNHVSVRHLSGKINGTQQFYVPTREVVHLLVESGKSVLLNQVKAMANSIAEAQGLCSLV